jgi:hypothetical protein
LVLSNAERQARFQKRLREKAVQGVTPEMVDQVARIMWERARENDSSMPLWDDVLAGVGSKKGRAVWADFMSWLGWSVPDEADLIEEHGEDAALVRKVLLVLQAVVRPPSEREGRS